MGEVVLFRDEWPATPHLKPQWSLRSCKKCLFFLYFCKGSEIAPKNLIMVTRIQQLVASGQVTVYSTVIHIVIVNFNIHRNWLKIWFIPFHRQVSYFLPCWSFRNKLKWVFLWNYLHKICEQCNANVAKPLFLYHVKINLFQIFL